MNISDHLEKRHCYPKLHDYSVEIDEINQVATFYLYDFNYKLIGYQAYRPNACKEKQNNEKGRYYKYAMENHMPVWGIESLHKYKSKILIITEGIFNACRFHNFKLPAIAVLSNNPKKLKNQLAILPYIKIAVCDPGKAGKMLAKYGNYSIQMSDDKDVGDLNEQEMLDLIKKIYDFT